MMDSSSQFANPERRVAELELECERYRARLAELERENANMEAELERRFREDILRDFGVTHEELLANPEKYALSSEQFRQELERLINQTTEHEVP